MLRVTRAICVHKRNPGQHRFAKKYGAGTAKFDYLNPKGDREPPKRKFVYEKRGDSSSQKVDNKFKFMNPETQHSSSELPKTSDVDI